MMGQWSIDRQDSGGGMSGGEGGKLNGTPTARRCLGGVISLSIGSSLLTPASTPYTPPPFMRETGAGVAQRTGHCGNVETD